MTQFLNILSPSPQDRQLHYKVVFGKINRQQMTTIDNVSNFLTNLMTFHDHEMTFVMTGEDLMMTLLTLGDNLLMTLLTTGDYLLMTHDDDTDNPCDDTDDLS